MSTIKLPFKPSQAAQATVAFLSAVGAIGTQVAHLSAGFLTADQSAALTGLLTAIAAVAGFIRTAEPIIDSFDKYAT